MERGRGGEDDRLERRRFLQLTGGTLAAGALAAAGLSGCSESGKPTGASSVPTTGSAGTSATASTAPTTSTTPATDAAWRTLAGNLQGTLVRPGDVAYSTDAQLFNPRFDDLRPAGIAQCASTQDVVACVDFARRHGVSPALRSGGHSFGGWSSGSGLVIDTGPLASVAVNRDGTATVGAGTRLIDLYAGLAGHSRMVPGGSCPTVGITGLTLGGGVGVVGRRYGLTCDNLTGAQVVLADGSVVRCAADEHADLFWALRGGGGGNFGVVTQLTFATTAAPALAYGTVTWPWAAAADVLPAWFGWAPSAPDELWSNCLLLARYDKGAGVVPLLQVGCVWVGDAAGLDAQLDALVRAVGAAPTTRRVHSGAFLDAMRYEGGCADLSVAACRLPSQGPAGSLEREGSVARSDYVATALPTKAMSALIDAVHARQADPALGQGGVAFDAYGGAINQVTPDATAFVHRHALAGALYSGSWHPGTSGSVEANNQAWVDGAWQAMRPFVNGEAYQNYVDPKLGADAWPAAYYGANLARLRRVKAAYDPHELFTFPQAIRPS